MSHMQNSVHEDNERSSWLFSRTGLVTVGAVAILGFLVYEGHGAHLLGYAPYLLFLACPLMHLFMHGHHGGHGDHSQHQHGDNEEENSGGCCGDGSHRHATQNPDNDRRKSS